MVRHKNRYLLVQVQYRSPYIGSPDDDYYGYGGGYENRNENDETAEPAKKKMKDVLKRYPVSPKVLYDAISEAIESEYGVFGRGAVKRSFAVKYWSSETGSAIVRCARRWHEMLIAVVNSIQTFTFINEDLKPETCDASLRILHVSGTINLCTKAALALGKSFIASMEIPEGEDDNEEEDEEDEEEE